MKKILSIALCVLMLVTALTACGEKPAPEEPVPEEPSVEVIAPVEQPEPEPEPLGTLTTGVPVNVPALFLTLLTPLTNALTSKLFFVKLFL